MELLALVAAQIGALVAQIGVVAAQIGAVALAQGVARPPEVALFVALAGPRLAAAQQSGWGRLAELRLAVVLRRGQALALQRCGSSMCCAQALALAVALAWPALGLALGLGAGLALALVAAGRALESAAPAARSRHPPPAGWFARRAAAGGHLAPQACPGAGVRRA